MPCLLPDVLAALSGEGPAADVRMLTPPAAVGAPGAGMEGGRPRAGGKGVYGEDFAYHVDGLNFTVQWDEASIDRAHAEALLVQLEAAWTVLVEDGGWPAPVSSDAWLVWVILDPDLAGSGYTTVYATDDYPEGYPVTYLNPNYEAEDPDFGLSVAVHEFAHALQYRLRDPSLGRSDSWFWEASAEWTAEHAAPKLDAYAGSAYWYAEWPEARFDRPERYHPYGMMLLDAYLDERVFGFSGIRDTWIASEGGDSWEAVIGAEAGRDFGELIAGMAAELAARSLREGSLYDAPVRAATHATAPAWETIDAPERYGSLYIDIGGGGSALVVEGDVTVAYVADGAVVDAPPEGPFTLVLTGLSEEGEVAYGVAPPTGEEVDAPRECGCRSGGPPGWLGLGIAAALGWGRRGARRAAARGRLPRGGAAL